MTTDTPLSNGLHRLIKVPKIDDFTPDIKANILSYREPKNPVFLTF